MLFYDMLIAARARDIHKSKPYRVEIIPRSLIKPEGNGTYIRCATSAYLMP